MNYRSCQHERSVIRNRPDSIGRPRYKTQCLDCGHYGKAGSNSLSLVSLRERGVDPEKVPPFDELAFAKSLEIDQADAARAALKELHDWEVERRKLAEERRAERAPYYQSPEWRERRAKVMKRAGGICEGCAESKAVQVHHTSYDNFGAEPLWELRAVCEECHEAIHRAQESEAEERFNQKEVRILESWFGDEWAEHLDMLTDVKIEAA